MDSLTPGTNTGSFSSKQLEWLETELREHKDTPAVIAFHDPIYFFGTLGMFDKANAVKFREIISGSNVLAVLNGHLHFPSVAIVDGVKYVQAGSPLWVNYYDAIGGEVTYDSSSFNVLTFPGDFPGSLWVRPVYFSEEQRLVDKTIKTS